MVRVPLEFTQAVDDKYGVIRQAYMDLSYLKPELCKQEHLTYDVRLSLEIHCNRNRHDDIYPIFDRILFLNTLYGASKQFLLNCDARYIYNGNNKVVPYNLRYWMPPALIDINKSVNINSYVMTFHEDQLKEALQHLVQIDILKNVIINHDNSFLEFVVQWDGFRYYLTKYYYRCLVVGVLLFYFVALFQIWLFNMVFLISRTNFGGKDDNSHSDDSGSSSDGSEEYKIDSKNQKHSKTQVKQEPIKTTTATAANAHEKTNDDDIVTIKKEKE